MDASSDRSMDGQVVVVTGAGRRGGLGEGIARRFAESGASVVLADIGAADGSQFPEHGVGTTSELEAVAEAVGQGVTGSVRTIVCDVRDEEQVQRLMAVAVAELGRIDVLVNNAGVGYLMAEVTDIEEADWDAVLDVNLKGTFLCTKHAARAMIAGGTAGRIVNISSQAGKSGFPAAGAYVSSKHGVIGFTRAAAVDLAVHGIRVNAVCPNHVTTGLGAWQNEYFARRAGQTVPDYLASMRARIPLARHGTPHDTAEACFFLAGTASSYITGEALNVSGGEETH